MPEVLVEGFIKCALILGEVGRRGRVLQSFSLRWIGCHLVKVRYQQCKEVRKKVLGGRGRGYSHGIWRRGSECAAGLPYLYEAVYRDVMWQVRGRVITLLPWLPRICIAWEQKNNMGTFALYCRKFPISLLDTLIVLSRPIASHCVWGKLGLSRWPHYPAVLRTTIYILA
jgi:hypothetical protein